MESLTQALPGYPGSEELKVNSEQAGWLKVQGDEDTQRYLNLNFVPELVIKNVYKTLENNRGGTVVQKDAEGARIFLETQISVRRPGAADQILQVVPAGSHHDAQLERMLLKIHDVLGSNVVDITKIT